MKPYTIEEAAAAFREGKVVSYVRESGATVYLKAIKAGHPEGRPGRGFTRPGSGEYSFVRDTLEGAIGAALEKGIEITVSENVPLGTVKKAPEPVVPLGDNVTRNGRKARVICNDRNSPDKGSLMVLALLRDYGQPDSSEVAMNYHKDGKHESLTQLDLIGHLPPSREYVEQETERFLAECKTWTGGASQDATAAAMISFAKRAKELQILRSALP